MGKIEKVVVLSVLVVIVGILVVSLTMDAPLRKDEVAFAAGAAPAQSDASTPMGSTGSTADSNLAPAGAAAAPKSKGDLPAATLSSNLTAPSSETRSVSMTLPPGSILKTAEGLQDSFMPDMKFYTWKAGDTFPILAQRFYGDLSRVATLRRVNEGRFDVQPGERILIPILEIEAGSAAAPVPTATSLPAPGAPAPSTAAPVKAAPGTPRIHVVKSGESLWKISKQELGAGSRWKEIYDANRDVLSSPEALHAGLKLRIP